MSDARPSATIRSRSSSTRSLQGVHARAGSAVLVVRLSDSSRDRTRHRVPQQAGGHRARRRGVRWPRVGVDRRGAAARQRARRRAAVRRTARTSRCAPGASRSSSRRRRSARVALRVRRHAARRAHGALDGRTTRCSAAPAAPTSLPVARAARARGGSRYIDFVVPGLLGMTIMGGGIWGLGFSIVDQRRQQSAQAARRDADVARAVSRVVSDLAARAARDRRRRAARRSSTLLFGVPMRGVAASTVAIDRARRARSRSAGWVCSSRRASKTIEGVSGLMNLTMLPMWVLSGVFFSSENFPRVVQPFIKALPLTATNDALRANMLRGVELPGSWPQLAVLARVDGRLLRASR